MTERGQHPEMTPYERRALAEIEKWRDNRLAERTRRLVPQALRGRLNELAQNASERFEALPGAAKFEKLFLQALQGVVGIGSRAAIATVPKSTIIASYRKHGYTVDDLAEIRKLDLPAIDKVKPRLGLTYTAAATAEGAGASFAISGGEALATGGTVFGAGAGGAPGAAVVIGAMAADAAAVLLAADRAVAHVAAYYGYDAELPGEQLFTLGVLELGTATEAGKVAAYAEINKVVQALARKATWEKLSQSVVTKAVQKVFTRLGFRLTQRKLGQAVPLIGIAIGAGMNAQLLQRVTDDAEHLYRERFLRERYGLEIEPVTQVATEEADTIDISKIIDAEIEQVDDPAEVGDGQEPCDGPTS